MTIRELLEKLGIEGALIEKIESSMKENRLYTAGEENLDIRYGKLKGQHDETAKKYAEAQGLIEQLKKGGADGEALKAKMAQYEEEIKRLTQEATEARLDGELKAALLAEGAKLEDMDYLTYKARNGTAKIAPGEDGKVEGIHEAVKSIKAAHAGNFQSGANAKLKAMPAKPPKDGDTGRPSPSTIEQAIKERYEGNREE